MSQSNILKLKQNSLKSNKQSTEVEVKQFNRPYSTAYKLKVLEQAANCKVLGEIGALLRRMGVSATSLHRWRVEQASGKLNHKTKNITQKYDASKRVQDNRLLKLERENAKLKTIIELQKKISELITNCQTESNEVTLCD